MSFTKFPSIAREFFRQRALTLTQWDVYHCLSAHCEYATGDVYAWVTVSGIAREVGCAKSTVSVAIKRIREVGLLINGTGVVGTLVGFASRPYKSAEDTRQKSERQNAVQSAVYPDHQIPDVHQTRDNIRAMKSPAPPYSASSPARNGNGTGASRFDNPSEKAAFAATNNRVRNKYVRE